MRVALLSTMTPPYRVPLYTELASTPGWEFMVFSSCKQEFDRSYELPSQFSFFHKTSFSFSYKRRSQLCLGGKKLNEISQVHIPLGLWADLWRYRPDIVISEDMGARSLITAIYARLYHKVFILWCYSTPHAARQISWKQVIVRRYLSKIPRAFIGMGHEARLYLESLGVRPECIFDAPQAIDHSRFRGGRSYLRSATRHKLGISGLCYLYVGRLIPLKGLTQLLEAWAIFCRHKPIDASLVLIGEGYQKEELMNFAASLGLDNVKFVPFVQPNRLPQMYRAADVFVFPTLKDLWGQVLGEAMACGLPVLCSKYDGSAAELIIEGQNGWIMDPLDVGDIVSKLRLGWSARDKKKAMGKVAQRVAGRLTISRMADGIREAVGYAFSKKYS